jgi:RimJ/RimL family protein N-acetyltransferase
MTISDVRLAEESDLRDIDALLCSAQKEIGLRESFCAPEKRGERLAWLCKLHRNDFLWVVRDDESLVGALILYKDRLGDMWVSYIVVAERMRGRGQIGPRLLQKAQTLSGFLKAEARNEYSRRLLEKHGFRWAGELSVLTWTVDD